MGEVFVIEDAYRRYLMNIGFTLMCSFDERGRFPRGIWDCLSILGMESDSYRVMEDVFGFYALHLLSNGAAVAEYRFRDCEGVVPAGELNVESSVIGGALIEGRVCYREMYLDNDTPLQRLLRDAVVRFSQNLDRLRGVLDSTNSDVKGDLNTYEGYLGRMRANILRYDKGEGNRGVVGSAMSMFALGSESISVSGSVDALRSRILEMGFDTSWSLGGHSNRLELIQKCIGSLGSGLLLRWFRLYRDFMTFEGYEYNLWPNLKTLEAPRSVGRSGSEGLLVRDWLKFLRGDSAGLSEMQCLPRYILLDGAGAPDVVAWSRRCFMGDCYFAVLFRALALKLGSEDLLIGTSASSQVELYKVVGGVRTLMNNVEDPVRCYAVGNSYFRGQWDVFTGGVLSVALPEWVYLRVGIEPVRLSEVVGLLRNYLGLTVASGETLYTLWVLSWKSMPVELRKAVSPQRVTGGFLYRNTIFCGDVFTYYLGGLNNAAWCGLGQSHEKGRDA